MGKGLIKSGGPLGQYQIEIVYDLSAITERVSVMEANIQGLIEQILVEEDQLKINILKLQIASYQKRIKYLQDNVPESNTIIVWCADLTENMSGEIAIAEVQGELPIINIRPGFTDEAIYTQERGIQQPTVALSGAGAFYNLAMLPGWQKWRPLYRYATIDSINGSLADITFENILSSQQSLNINQSASASGVEIEYMDCNGDAFEEGDIVLVEFTEQKWSQPKIIGFKDNPKPCGNRICAVFNWISGTNKRYVVVELETLTLLSLKWPNGQPIVQPFKSGSYSINQILDSNNLSWVSYSNKRMETDYVDSFMQTGDPKPPIVDGYLTTWDGYSDLEVIRDYESILSDELIARTINGKEGWEMESRNYSNYDVSYDYIQWYSYNRYGVNRYPYQEPETDLMVDKLNSLNLGLFKREWDSHNAGSVLINGQEIITADTRNDLLSMVLFGIDEENEEWEILGEEARLAATLGGVDILGTQHNTYKTPFRLTELYQVNHTKTFELSTYFQNCSAIYYLNYSTGEAITLAKQSFLYTFFKDNSYLLTHIKEKELYDFFGKTKTETSTIDFLGIYE